MTSSFIKLIQTLQYNDLQQCYQLQWSASSIRRSKLIESPVPELCTISHIKMGAAKKEYNLSWPYVMYPKTKFFASPFQDELPKPQKKQQFWRPAFSDDSDEEFDAMSARSSPYSQHQEQYPNNKILGDYSSDSLQGLDFSVNGLQLEDLEKIDVTLPELRLKAENNFFKDMEEVFSKINKSGDKRLQSEKYDGNPYDEDWMRRLDKVIAARAFVHRGYGINFLKEELRSGNYDRFALDETKYKSISGSMVREAFRKLQSFLLRQCKRKLQSLAAYEMKLLQTLLLNCRSTLNPQASALFIQVVKATFNLDKISISQQQALALYEAIYRGLQKKISLLRGNARSSSPSMDGSRMQSKKPLRAGQYLMYDSDTVTPQRERDIIREYSIEQSLSKIRDNLRNRHLIGDAVTTKTLRNVLRRVLRSTIRKLQQVVGNTGVDYRGNSKMNDQQIKWIIEAGEGSQARKLLCRIYLDDRQDQRIYESVYRDLKALLMNRDHYPLGFRGARSYY